MRYVLNIVKDQSTNKSECCRGHDIQQALLFKSAIAVVVANLSSAREVTMW